MPMLVSDSTTATVINVVFSSLPTAPARAA